MQGWRSEPMCKVHLFIQSDAARDTVDELAREGVLQFIDLNSDKSAFQRRYVNEVKNCDEMERKIRYFAEQVNKLKIELPANAQKLEDEDSVKLDVLSEQFEELERDLREMAKGQEQMDRNYNELIESRYVLTMDAVFFSESAAAGTMHQETLVDDEEQGLRMESAARTGGLGFITGVVSTAKLGNFERVLFRSTRGNMFLKHADIPEDITDPVSGEKVKKTVFIVFFSGERSKIKIRKVCDSFHANIYPCPDSAMERDRLREQLDERISDLQRVLDRTTEHRRAQLQKIASEAEAWSRRVKKEKAVYHALNMFNYDITRKALMAEAWVPVKELERVRRALRRGSDRSGALVPAVLTPVTTTDVPPTHFVTDKFTKAFQDIIDSYGVARYGEVNPAVLTVVTFPFLFAVMFGDVGHGVIMVLAALMFILKENSLKKMKLNEMVGTCFSGRYMLLLMGSELLCNQLLMAAGLFSIYTGLLYNEWFSRPMDLFGSAWHYPEGSHIAVKDPLRTYAFGVDPVWKDTQTELAYYNSLKMKMSVIFGVGQMMMGLFLKLLNSVHFKQWKDVMFEFIPEVLFMGCIFGYLIVIIFVKWFTDWTLRTIQPPSLINMLIGMFLSPGNVPADKTIYPGQSMIQLALLVIAFLSLPVLLLPKPLLLLREYKQRMRYSHLHEELPEEDVARMSHLSHSVSHSHGHASPSPAPAPPAAAAGHGHGSGEFAFGEIMVHQIIHTIEFALGTVSNTASYLRLWALSLAHSELANVFWQKILVGFIGSSWTCPVPTWIGSLATCPQPLQFQISLLIIGALKMFVGAGAFFGVTMGVLMIMESLSAFLHALRLHWVEFQNKFYHGDGHKFKPFSYAILLHPEEE